MDPLKANDLVKAVLGETDAVVAADHAADLADRMAVAQETVEDAQQQAASAERAAADAAEASKAERAAAAQAADDARARTAAAEEEVAALRETAPGLVAAARVQSEAGPPPEEQYGGRRAMFVGLLGGLVQQSGDETWAVLYLDLALTTWLLVQPKSIVSHKVVEDRATPDLKWNMLWVKATASVGSGTGPVDDAQFLTGDFVRAGNFPSTPVGGTFDGDVGVYRLGASPNCCTRKSR
jgi:hypothetical protein